MGRRSRSEYGRSYKLKWNEALHEQYAQIVQYRRYRKAREFRHEPLVWEDTAEDDSTSQSTDSVGVAPLDDRQEINKTEEEKTSTASSDGGDKHNTDGAIEKEAGVKEVRGQRKKRGKHAGGEERVGRTERRPPFHPYGWANNAIGAISDRRTHNVKAPQEEVYPSALRALKRKQADQRIQDELRQRRSLERKRLEGAFNLGEIRRENDDVWLTEYQRSYSGIPKQRHATSVY